jgi:hypothetical protein
MSGLSDPSRAVNSEIVPNWGYCEGCEKVLCCIMGFPLLAETLDSDTITL